MGNKTQPWFGAARRLSERSTDSYGLAVDKDGVTLGPDFPLIRKTSRGYETATLEELSCLREVVSLGSGGMPRLVGHLESIAKALGAGDLAKARILGLYFPINRLTQSQIDRLTKASALLKESFNPDEPRDERGRWTTGSATIPSSSATSGVRTREGVRGLQSSPSNPNLVLAGDELSNGGPSDKEWCTRVCSDLVLCRGIGKKRAPDQGMAFYRCLNQCLGINDYPEWRDYFPRRTTEEESNSSTASRVPWWTLLPFLPIPGNPLYGGI